MTSPTCPRCLGHGYRSRAFYTAAKPCTCPVGARFAAYDALSIEDQAAARHARRDARRAAEAGR